MGSVSRRTPSHFPGATFNFHRSGVSRCSCPPPTPAPSPASCYSLPAPPRPRVPVNTTVTSDLQSIVRAAHPLARPLRITFHALYCVALHRCVLRARALRIRALHARPGAGAHRLRLARRKGMTERCMFRRRRARRGGVDALKQVLAGPVVGASEGRRAPISRSR